MLILHGAKVVTATSVVEGGDVSVEGEHIVAVGDIEPDERAETLDLSGHWLLPGFVDLHNHGGGGGSYAIGDQESALAAFRFHRGHGTTTSIASMVTAPVDQLAHDIAAMSELVEDGVLAGIHLEGPFISALRCGAHDPTLLREPDPAALRRLVDAGHGTVRMVTLAPELTGGIAAVRMLVDAGVIAAVGHTDADTATAMRAFDAGASVATHLFNGMRPINHREPGPVVAALQSEHVTVELINDGIHLHQSTVDMAFQSIGSRRIAFITDAISAAGLPDGEFALGSMHVRVENGAAMISGTNVLAGSTVTLDAVLRRGVQVDGLPIVDVSAALSGTPARALGLADRLGTIAAGQQADLLVLDADLTVVGVLARGRWVEPLTSSVAAKALSANQ